MTSRDYIHQHIMVESVEYQSYDKEKGCTFKKIKNECAVKGCNFKNFYYYYYFYPPSSKDKSRVLNKNKKRASNH